jgi:hypothetical protein
MDTRIACPQVAHRRLPALLPIHTVGEIAEYQPDQKRIFPLDWAGHYRQRVIAANFSDGYLGFAQRPGNDRRRVFGPQSLAEPLSVSISRGHDQSPAQGAQHARWYIGMPGTLFICRYTFGDYAPQLWLHHNSSIEAFFDKTRPNCPNARANAEDMILD